MRIHTIQLNVQDFLSGSSHLDATELGARVSLLVSLYNSKENKLPNDDKRLARIARCTHRKWMSIKDVVLQEFTIKDDFIEHKRVQKEVRRYNNLCAKNKSNALKRKDSVEPVGDDSLSQTPANKNNKEQIINNNKKNKQKKNNNLECPSDVSDQVWEDFLNLRKKKNAPLTQTALNGIINQAKKAGWPLEDALSECCIRGWQGFNSDWVPKREVNLTKTPEQVYADCGMEWKG